MSFAGPKRVVPLPIDIADLPQIDVVLISHNHYDHLDAESVRRIAAMPQGSPLFLVPMGLKAWFAELGITRVEELDWWQQTQQGDLRITFVPAQHWSKRTLTDANQTLWGGWVVEGEGLSIIHTGDTGFSQDFRDIGERLGPFDMAFIPIGSYAPRWFMKTMHADVAEAVQIRSDLRAGARDRHALGHVRVARGRAARRASARARAATRATRAQRGSVRRTEDRRNAAVAQGDAALTALASRARGADWLAPG